MEFWFQLINHHLLKLTPSCRRQHHRKIMAVLRFAMPAMLLTLFYKRKLERISKMFIGFVVSKSRIILLVFLDSDGWSRHRQQRVDFQDFGCFKVKLSFCSVSFLNLHYRIFNLSKIKIYWFLTCVFHSGPRHSNKR